MDTVRTPRASSNSLRQIGRVKRSPESSSVQKLFKKSDFYLSPSPCYCTETTEKCQTASLKNVLSPTTNRGRCFCVKNRLANTTGDCYPAKHWKETLCSSCEQKTGFCKPGRHGDVDCSCHKKSGLCLLVPFSHQIRFRRSRRKKRSDKEKAHFTYDPCECHNGTCAPIVTADKGKSSAQQCLCFYNVRRVFSKNIRVFEDCIQIEQWKSRGCFECGDNHLCEDNSALGHGEPGSRPCLCNDKIKKCIDEEFVGITPPWPSTTTPLPTLPPMVLVTKPKPKPTDDTDDFDQAQGLKNMTDSVAISTRAKENLVFAASSLNTSTKIGMSYSARELLKKCSYSGHQCDIDDDFKLYVDPTYGNCYTFNSNSSAVAGSSRAGPFYGLRVQVFLNTSDYLPTTEAAGVRLATHPQGEQPFPDTAGYSAPTGFVSSFGIYLKRVDRLPAPYGDCIGNGKTDKYIYQDSAYTVEGCHRSCLQELVVRNCGCSDPRFPVFPGSSSCSSNDPSKRQCIDDTLASFGGLYGEGRHGCECREPCRQMVFSVTYSASQWPASAGQVDCPEFMNDKECVEYFKNQAAMIEVYYEELNYQHLEETEAYGWSNLLADFGGQLGLWLGVSVITVIEFLVFIGKIFSMGCIKFRRTVRGLRGQMASN